MVVALVHLNHLQEVSVVRGPALHERGTENLKGAGSDRVPCVEGLLKQSDRIS